MLGYSMRSTLESIHLNNVPVHLNTEITTYNSSLGRLEIVFEEMVEIGDTMSNNGKNEFVFKWMN